MSDLCLGKNNKLYIRVFFLFFLSSPALSNDHKYFTASLGDFYDDPKVHKRWGEKKSHAELK